MDVAERPRKSIEAKRKQSNAEQCKAKSHLSVNGGGFFLYFGRKRKAWTSALNGDLGWGCLGWKLGEG